MRRFVRAGFWPPALLAGVWAQLLLLLALAASPACALDWNTLAQPVGTFVGDTANPSGVYAPASINAVLGGTPPFDAGTSVTLIRLTQTQQFVRFYNPTDAVNPSNAVGSWMMRASEIRGLSAAQIRDKFALPALPTNMVQVIVPTGYAVYTGIAAPIAAWGEGGGLQNRLMANKPPSGDIAADPWLAAGNYVNAQALAAGAPVLSYRYAARASAAGARMGAYMDGLAPRVGGDLQGVYNALDTLYFSGRTADVAQAMDSFSPARFSALTDVSLRATALQAASLDARSTQLALGLDGQDAPGGEPVLLAFSGGAEELAAVLPRLGQRQGRWNDWSLWLRGTGEYLRDNARGETPYAAATAAVHAGADRRVAPDLVLGLGVGLARTMLDWEQDGGDAATSTLSLSGYGFWNSGEWFANADLGLEAAFTEARRRIHGAVADRVARSSQSGGGVSARLRAGRRIALGGSAAGWTLIPSLEAGYALHRQDAFHETGAGDLGLDVRAATAQTLRTGAEFALARRVELADGGVLAPEAAAGWLRETPLDSRVLRASFSGYSEGFQSYGDDSPRDSLTLRAGLVHADAGGFTRFLRYSGTLRERFQAHSLELGCRWSF